MTMAALLRLRVRWTCELACRLILLGGVTGLVRAVISE
jgi:hypothetical protein